MADTVRTRHRISGQIDENTPRHVAEHPVLGKYLDIVSDDAKPYVPELFKAKTEKPSREDVKDTPKVELPKIDPTEDHTPNKNGKD